MALLTYLESAQLAISWRILSASNTDHLPTTFSDALTDLQIQLKRLLLKQLQLQAERIQQCPFSATHNSPS